MAMQIGIDISQIAFEGTGVATYVRNLVSHLIEQYPEHSYTLFGASLRQRQRFITFTDTLSKKASLRLVTVPIPPTILEFFWNRLGFPPVEWFTGPLDIFWSSDWTQPKTSAIAVTTIHDLSIYRYELESHNKASVDMHDGTVSSNIVAVQKRRLKRAAHLCTAFFCDSEATKKDAMEILHIPEKNLHIVYPGWGTV